jgi:lysophospholipase L1-like esterase
MLAASADLSLVFGPSIVIDAGVGRHSAAGLARLAAYRAAGRLRGLRALVIGLGSNGPFNAANLNQLRQLAAGVPLVVLINVRVPDSWEMVSNQTIDSAAALPGFKVVDWHTASARPGLLWPDGVHPDPAGQQVYAALVAQAASTAPAQTSTPAKLVRTSPSTVGGTRPIGLNQGQ